MHTKRSLLRGRFLLSKTGKKCINYHYFYGQSAQKHELILLTENKVYDNLITTETLRNTIRKNVYLY